MGAFVVVDPGPANPNPVLLSAGRPLPEKALLQLDNNLY
jgi:hypothetical protein